MKRYVNMIIIVVCSLALSVFTGCGAFIEGLAEGGKDLRDYNPNENHTHVHVDDDSWYWRMEWEKEKLRRLERQEALEAARIREHTRRMLKRMELERKLREQR